MSFFIVSYLPTLIDSYLVDKVSRAVTSSCDHLVLFGLLTVSNNIGGEGVRTPILLGTKFCVVVITLPVDEDGVAPNQSF